ncbi:MAG: hypothetical protein ACYTF5_19360 [Planctomycetota bacterium]|jgi:biopolymer transport protein ExbD
MLCSQLPLRSLAILALLALAAACPAQKQRVELPRVGTVGDEPPVASTCVVEIHRNGRIQVAGKTLTYRELRTHLVAEAKKLPGRVTVFGRRRLVFSNLNLLIRADRGLPSAAVSQVLWLCVNKGANVSRVFYGVRHDKTGEAGAMALFLAADPGDDSFAPLEVTIEYGLRGANPGALHRPVRRAAQGEGEGKDKGGKRNLAVSIDAPGDVPFGYLLRSLDVCLRAGATSVSFGVTMTKAQLESWNAGATREDLHALVWATRMKSIKPGLRIDDLPVFGSGSPLPPTERVRGKLTGQLKMPYEIIEEEEEVEEPAEDENWQWAFAEPPRPYQLRRFGRRSLAACGEQEVATAIERGLDWLWRNQVRQGSWAGGVGATGAALLAFTGDANTMKSGPRKSTIKRGVSWLRMQQGPDGRIGPKGTPNHLRDHAIATYAICEVQGLSRSAVLKKNAQSAINYLHLGDEDAPASAWTILCYRAAKDFGLTLDERAPKALRRWLDGHAATAGALLGRFMLGDTPAKHPEMTAVARRLHGRIKGYDAWFFTSHALFQMGDDHWDPWCEQLRVWIRKQRDDGSWGDRDERAYATAMMVLALQASYRYRRVWDG